MYQNGKEINSSDTHGAQTVSSLASAIVNQEGSDSHCYVARSNYSDPCLNGSFTDIKLFDKALSANEVKELFDVSAQNIVDSDSEALNLENITDMKDDFYLPTTGLYGSTITWAASNSSVEIEQTPVEVEGQMKYLAHVNRPASGQPSASVVLTATLNYTTGTTSASKTKDFNATVAPIEADEQIAVEDLQKAMSTLSGMFDETVVLPLKGDGGSSLV